jgi:hypothetical protein
MLTFNTPCLRWKLQAAVKLQFGWPGFVPPYSTRYLSKLVTITVTPTFNFPNGPSTVSSQQWIMDKEGNLISPADGEPHANADFPYGEPLTEDPVHSETWEVTETFFKHVYNDGEHFVQTEVQLSQPYETADLEQDADAILAGMNVAAQPWDTWQSAGDLYPRELVDMADALPGQVRNASQETSGPFDMEVFNSAAWYTYVLGEVSGEDWQPNGYMKTIGHVAMAGNYCQKTFFVDANGDVLDQNCVSGVGSCKNPFIVQPPGLVPGKNAYVLIVPNCVCSG